MRIQSFFSLSIFMLVLTLFVSGCNKNENEAIESTNKSIVGSSDLLAELSYLSTVETKSGTITISCVNGDDHMTQELVSFGDKYITGQASSTSYIIDSYGSDRFTFTILPYRY